MFRKKIIKNVLTCDFCEETNDLNICDICGKDCCAEHSMEQKIHLYTDGKSWFKGREINTRKILCKECGQKFFIVLKNFFKLGE